MLGELVERLVPELDGAEPDPRFALRLVRMELLRRHAVGVIKVILKRPLSDAFVDGVDVIA